MDFASKPPERATIFTSRDKQVLCLTLQGIVQANIMLLSAVCHYPEAEDAISVLVKIKNVLDQYEKERYKDNRPAEGQV